MFRYNQSNIGKKEVLKSHQSTFISVSFVTNTKLMESKNFLCQPTFKSNFLYIQKQT